MSNRWFPWLAIVAMLLFSAVVYSQLPDHLPARWSFGGEVLDTRPKLLGALLLPGLAALIVVGRGVLRRVDPRRENYERFAGTYQRYVNVGVIGVTVLHVATLGSSIGWEIPLLKGVTILAGLMLALIANEARRVQPNWFIGIRTPWTLSDPQVWRETHALAGRLLFFAALLIVVMGFVLPASNALVLSLAILTATFAFLVYYSYRVYQRQA
jgi:uncharacterized membrane protein